MSTNASLPTRSTKLREKGNAIYNQLGESLRDDSTSLSLVVCNDRVNRAKQLYKEAMESSTTLDERCSCRRNLALLCFRHCKLYFRYLSVCRRNERFGVLESDDTMIKWNVSQHVSQTVENLVMALRHGVSCKPNAWIDDLILLVNDFIKWSSVESPLLCFPHSPLLHYVCDSFSKHLDQPYVSAEYNQAYKLEAIEASFRTQAHMNYSDALFKEALTKQQSDQTNIDYRACSPLLHDCDLHLRKAIDSYLPHLDITKQDTKSLVEDIHALKASVFVHLSIYEGLKLIDLGDKAREQALMEEDHLNMEVLQGALDYYRQAVMAVNERDMETEAIAMNRIGVVYVDVLKMESTGYKFHYNCVRLAHSVMSPRIGRSDWYKRSLEKVEQHQKRVAEREREEHAKSRAPVVERLKEKIDKLSREGSKGPEAFLQFVYAEHPHKDMRKNVVPRVDTKEHLKQSIRKAILHYHPDQNGAHSEEWKVLCEEICKHLNRMHECVK